jgi:hypothetical protein
MWRRTGRSIPGARSPFLALLFLLAPIRSSGQELKTSVNKNPVSPGERLTYTIEMRGGQAKIAAPDFDAFQRVYGPSKSTHVQVMNGQVSRSIKVSFTLVAPDEEGTVRIGAAEARTNSGKLLKGAPIELKVKKGGEHSSPSASSTGKRNERLIAKIALSKSSVFKGEPVRVNYLLYSRYRRISFTKRPDYPSIGDAWTEEIDNGSDRKSGLVKIDGKAYRKIVLRQQLIFPQNPGEIRIDPITAECRVNHGFFNKGKTIKIKSNSPTLQVEPLPDGAPEDFSGAVGDFELKAGMRPDTVKTNGSVDLKVRISGSGNLNLLEAPSVKIPPDLEHYDPNMKDRSTVGPTNMRGRKEWEFLLVPRQSGDYRLGPVSFSYFDPSDGRYKTLQEGPFELHVKAEKAKGTKVPRGRKKAAKEEVDVLDEELRYIRTDLRGLQKKESQERSSFRAILPTLPPLIGALLFLFWTKKQARDREGKGRARKTARARLRDAERALRNGDRPEFHEELYKGLQSYLSDRTGIPHAELDKERIRERMRGMGIPQELLDRTLRTLQNSEMLRYAPGQDVPDETVHEETVGLLAELEPYWK